MEQVIEREISLPNVSVLLANVRWGAVQEFRPLVPGYYICQRLSDDHAPLRFENPGIRNVFPHVRSVGLLPPAFSVRVHAPETSFRGLNCVFEKAFFENTTDIDPDRWDDSGSAFMRIQNRRLSAMMQQIYAELTNPAFGGQMIIEAASTMILVEMARYLQCRGGKPPARDRALRGGLAPWQLRRIRDRVEASLEIGYPNLSELATLCGISQGHLMRAFKISTGMQIHKYITEERLNAAKRLLAEDELSVAEIADRLGFCSPAYFATAFRRQAGMTPTDYRQRARAGDFS